VKPEIATSLLERIERLIIETRTIAAAAKKERQWISAVAALKEVRACLELLGKLTGEISSSSATNFNFLNLSEANVTAMLDAVAAKGDLAMAGLRALVHQKLGNAPPVFSVQFMDSDGNGQARTSDQLALPGIGELLPPTNGNGHA
jgi:hypothetical protein